MDNDENSKSETDSDLIPRNNRFEVWKNKIIFHHAKAVEAWGQTLFHAWACGRYLRMMKKHVGGHGRWLSWLKRNFKGTDRTARNCMRLAKHYRKGCLPNQLHFMGFPDDHQPESRSPSHPFADSPSPPRPSRACADQALTAHSPEREAQ